MSNKPEFVEDWVSEHQDTLDGKNLDFDYAAIDRALAPSTSEPILAGMTRETVDQLIYGLSGFQKWVLGRRRLGHHRTEVIAHRFIGGSWAMNPHLFDGRSLSQIAKLIGVPKMTLSRHSADFSRVFGIRNRGQRHGWSFKAR